MTPIRMQERIRTLRLRAPFARALWMGLALAAVLTGRAGAQIHPVPLDQNTDAAKCVECHEDKTKGKSVHSAMAMGCMS